MVTLRQSLQSYSTVLADVLLSVSCEPSPWPLLADPHSANDRIRAVAGCWRFEPQDSSSPFPASFVLHFDSVPVHLSYTELKLVLDARLSTRTPSESPIGRSLNTKVGSLPSGRTVSESSCGLAFTQTAFPASPTIPMIRDIPTTPGCEQNVSRAQRILVGCCLTSA